MAVVEKVKAYFEGETRDLERKIAKLDGDIDRLTDQARYAKFAAGVVVAFEVFQEVGPMVVGALRSISAAAIATADNADVLHARQKMVNDEWERTKAAFGTGLLGDMERMEYLLAGISGYLQDIADNAPNIRNVAAYLSPLAGLGGIAAVVAGRALDNRLESRGRQYLIDQRMKDGFYTLDEQSVTAPRPPRRPSIPLADYGPEGGMRTDPFIREGLRDTSVFDEMSSKVDNVALSFDRAATAQDHFTVAMETMKDVGLASLRQHLQEQLRFENVKKASGKRILRETVSDIGSAALAEAAYQAALAVGYLFVNPAKAASHAQSAAMLGAIAGGAALAYAGLGGSFDSSQSGSGGGLSGGSRTDQGGSASARTVAAATSIGTITFNLTFIYNGPAYYVGPGGLEQFVGDIVPALNDRIDSGELRAAS